MPGLTFEEVRNIINDIYDIRIEMSANNSAGDYTLCIIYREEEGKTNIDKIIVSNADIVQIASQLDSELLRKHRQFLGGVVFDAVEIFKYNYTPTVDSVRNFNEKYSIIRYYCFLERFKVKDNLSLDDVIIIFNEEVIARSVMES